MINNKLITILKALEVSEYKEITSVLKRKYSKNTQSGKLIRFIEKNLPSWDIKTLNSKKVEELLFGKLPPRRFNNLQLELVASIEDIFIKMELEQNEQVQKKLLIQKVLFIRVEKIFLQGNR